VFVRLDAQVKPSAAAVVASNIVKAAPAPASAAGIPKAPEAAAPVDAKLGVLFEKLSLSSRLELSSAQYNAKIDEAVKVILCGIDSLLCQA
jgi:hypothetical protein